ncbi:polyphosphate kinase [Salsuginibacillus halophilus]|uniref:Polyphosphate kinase n=1 Tax=Salsuginibacillus halophilus TaxID=517424 RepID=A0A2P8HAK7_9BACI|nr:RNA degradosome polyphosphate kinase [Salsuginibacillus halophilus]PSL43265.1 polyphosphate kinase [Salsuginibacillus halophilus]
MTQTINLDNPAYYNNRELSWLAFNERVLEEAVDPYNPLLERLKFLAIFSANLDEFYMVRVAGLKDQVKAGFNKPENKARLTPKQQLEAIGEKTRRLTEAQEKLFENELMPALKDEQIEFLSVHELDHAQLSFVEAHFQNYIFPVVTPMAVDTARPFPLLLSKSLNLAVTLTDESTQAPLLAIVQVPRVLARVIELPHRPSEGRRFMLLEDVITYFAAELFPGYTVASASTFRITRNADLSLDEEDARDLLRDIEKELEKRKWGAAVRLEVSGSQMDEGMLHYLIDVLDVAREDVYSFSAPLDFTFLFSLYEQLAPGAEHLVNEALIPQSSKDLPASEDLFQTMTNGDILLHHPYESFHPVLDLLSQAASDPDVLAIKQTLYRVADDSPIIESLLQAAENGKEVTVLVEIKARFDEENNIQWAKTLEKAGVHVIYGFPGLKTHSKITLIVRHEKSGLRRYMHFGTGNYNEKTAKLYTDTSLLTTNRAFGEDATHFFNYLSGFSFKPAWQEFAAAPGELRHTFITWIDKEIEMHRTQGNGWIQAKMNSLTDKTLIMKLFEASQAGVKIDLLVRGICCLRPGIEGVSENIHVRSIVDRFLEHSRLFYFHQNGSPRYFLSSADWMTRNMEKRIELLVPVYDMRAQKKIDDILRLAFTDNVKARVQQPDGRYTYTDQAGTTVQSQLELYALTVPFRGEAED